jgi:hypothetical protein
MWINAVSSNNPDAVASTAQTAIINMLTQKIYLDIAVTSWTAGQKFSPSQPDGIVV